MMNVIDISGWQAGLDLATMYAKNPDLDAVIVKATGGVCIYQKDTFVPWAEWLIANGKPWGFYHFLDDDLKNSSGKAEAEFFVSKTKDYFGRGIPIIDYEGQARQMGTKYLKECLDTVYALTGIKPMLYCSQSVAHQTNMTAIANAGYPLWVAQYANYNPMYGFTQNPWRSGSVEPFKGEDLRQYTSQMYLPGWKSHLDADLFYGDRIYWDYLVSVAPVFPPAAAKKTVDDVAREVINGDWGNGQSRRRALEDAGFNYAEVQARVNELLKVKPKKTADIINEVAKEVIAGKYGNGAVRVARLRLAGYDPAKVQAEVNRILRG